MKKLIAAIFAVLSIAVMGAISANASEEYSLGDVNGDGKLDSSDSSAVLEYFSAVSTGKDSGWDDERIAAGDVDGDGKTDSSDASYILSYFSYVQTSPENAELLPIKEFIAEMEDDKSSNVPPAEEVPIENFVLSPKGLDPGKPGTIQYIINTAELVEHDEIPLYNIKGDNDNGGKPMFVRNYTVTEEDKKILNDFAKEHFTDDMTNYDRLKFTWEWLHFNVTYANGSQGWNTYDKIMNLSFVQACFEEKLGQCIQYNGAFAEIMAYMGYDVYMLEKWNGANFTNQHFISEVNINGLGYNTEVGETSYDNPSRGYYWMWLFDHSKQEFFGLEN